MSEQLIHICKHCGYGIPYFAEDTGWNHTCPHCGNADVVGVNSEVKQASAGKAVKSDGHGIIPKFNRVTGKEAESGWVNFLQFVAYICLASGFVGSLLAAHHADDSNQDTSILVILTPAIVGVTGCVTYLFFSHLTNIFERIEKHLKKLSDKD